MNAGWIGKRIFCQIAQKAQGILYVFTSIFVRYDGKLSDKTPSYLFFNMPFYEFRKIYGAGKIQQTLSQRGISCSLKRVQHHMQRQGLRSIVMKKYRHHGSCTVSTDGKENLLNRCFEAKTINQKWVTDITYIYVLEEGWTYLASVMDLCSRKIIGYAYGTQMTAQLAIQAVENACLNVKSTEGIILHSDLGSQYTSHAFGQCLAEKKIIHSYSRKGNPYDNACIESFHSVLKKEEVYLNSYRDFQEAKVAIFKYIEVWYNRKRIHSYIGFLTPQQKEDLVLDKAA